MSNVAPIFVYNVLKKYSDKDSPLTQERIVTLVKSEYDYDMERRAVSRCLDVIDTIHGAKVVDVPRKGKYLDDSVFSPAEVRILVDSIAYARHLPTEEKRKIINKLYSFASDSFKKADGATNVIGELSHASKKDFLKIIEKINEALARKCKVAFCYNEYGADKKLHPVGNKILKVSPLQLAIYDNSYYLIANVDGYDGVDNFRLDKITDIKVLGTQSARSRHEFIKSSDVGRYVMTHGFMKEGKDIPVTVRVRKEWISPAIDFFGTSCVINQYDDMHYDVKGNSTEKDLYIWAMQNGEYVEVLYPQSVRDRIRQSARRMHRIYHNGEQDDLGEMMNRARNIRILSAQNMKVKDYLLSQKSLPDVRNADFVGTDLHNFLFLERMPSIIRLSIMSNRVDSLNFLSKLPSLKVLSIVDTDLSDLSPLRGMTLNSLTLSYNKTTDYSPIYGMTSLLTLEVDDEIMDQLDLKLLKEKFPDIKICRIDCPYPTFNIKEVNDRIRSLGTFPDNLLRDAYGTDIEIEGDREEIARRIYLSVRNKYIGGEKNATLVRMIYEEGASIEETAVALKMSERKVNFLLNKTLNVMKAPLCGERMARFVKGSEYCVKKI